ncbi:uncharacterized protein LOC129238677 isoform X1 [Anastrepha obliqua]|uniref:uncharacterized protein LOC129238677 isoform X1 n=1 Tax=Anastrepha obliqua TaxID=95512 RepID=UPI0024098919|nr:uncharacterized protein LOC129238677 isoform X1 [Anastrepha obliqua]
MARGRLVNMSALASLWLCALLLLQMQYGDTVPTHHLTVSVEGNTPTLIVTSAEIGITPKIVHASTATTIAPSAAVPAVEGASKASSEGNIEEFGSKGNVPKLKGKSYKLQHGKKWQYAVKGREKSKEKVSKTQDVLGDATLVAKTTTTANLVTRSVEATTTSAVPPMQTAKTIKLATNTSLQHFGESLAVAPSAKENITNSSVGSLAPESVKVTRKSSQLGSEGITHNKASTAGAVVSAAAGNMPQSTETATEVTLAPTATASSTSSSNEAAESAIEEDGGGIALDVAEATNFHGVELDTVTSSGNVEKVTATSTFIESHDTTAGATAKTTSTAAPTDAAVMEIAKKAISATTENAPLIAIQIETLPKVTTKPVTTKPPQETTTPFETVTSSGIIEHQPAKTSKITTTECTKTVRVDGASRSGPTVTTAFNDSSTLLSTVIERSSTNIGDNLSQSSVPPTGEAAIAAKQPAINVSRATTSTETAQKATTSISVATKIPANPSETTTKSALTKQATQGVTNTDSGIIFIDDVPDNREGKKAESETDAEVAVQLQRDEAVIGRHEGSKAVKRDKDDTSGSEGIIKLIDLEKHDLKSIPKAMKLRNGSNNTSVDDDDGHDGVKKTRKKQLTDKHYLLVPDINVSAELHAENNTTAGARTTNLVDTAEMFKNENSRRSDVLPQTTPPVEALTMVEHSIVTSSTEVPPTPRYLKNAENFAKATPTLKPVHNGYLGPILMEEKRFSVVHASKQSQQHHESAIESQLRDGRIVEILAPTALMEQNNAAVPKAFDVVANKIPTTTTTSAPAPVSAAFVQMAAEPSTPMLSTTVFQVPESMMSTTRLPLNTKPAGGGEEKSTMHYKPSQHKQNQQQQTFFSPPKGVSNVRTESKISDIQVEVYDSTVDSIVASTNFKDSDGFYALPLEAELDTQVGTTKPPAAPQERFTQYVVDRADYATQESSVAPHLSVASGKPEPAAIEIHINVSEGIGNESEDLEFSYRQPDYTGSSFRTNHMDELLAKTAKAISMKPLAPSTSESSTRENVERGDEILVVEIIDTGENSTESLMSAENPNPIFTFRSDPESDVELKDIKYFPPEVKVKPPQMSDELFLADLKKENALPKPPLPPPPPPRKPTIDRDSDTIFYISNTEVKVGESLPTTNTNYEQQQIRKTRLENQFFPANYLASTHPNAARLDEQLSPQQHRYEEDIILSPLSNTADSLKIFRSQGDGAPPLDVTYVGESVMEVEQLSGTGATTTIPSTSSLLPDVIIQPAILPEMSIGVPVIGELPPQIELKEIDFMPDEANQQHSGMYENNMLDENGNDVDRLVESSMQYGGDLIDESVGGGGFDGVEGSYPFGNPTALHNKAHHVVDYAHFTVNHGVNNLRKDELSVDVAGSGEMMAGQPAAAMPSSLEEELLTRSGNETLPLSMIANGSYAGTSTEHMSNATAYSVREDPTAIELVFKNNYALIIGISIMLLPLVVTISMKWCLCISIYGSPNSPEANQTNGNVANGKKGGDGGNSQEESNIDTATSIPKQQLPSSTENPSNGDCFKAMQNEITHSNFDECHNIKPSSMNANNILCNGASGVSDVTCVSVDEKTNEVLLLLAEEPVATPSSHSVPSTLSSGDNIKSKTQANLSNNSVQGNFARPNGSVTKMTLKNNHLIVETEERHDISRVARETTMHYNTSEKDGVFVVEVARGVDSKSIPGSPTTEDPRPIYETLPAAAAATSLRSEDEKVLRNLEEIQIHQPPPESIQQQPPNCIEEIPERSLHQIVELEEPSVSPHSFRAEAAGARAQEKFSLVRNSNTGLSQSDLSSTSSTNSNKRYSYGNQELYTIESVTCASALPTTNMPLTHSAAHNVTEDDDRRSENGHCLEHSPASQGNAATTMAKDSVNCNELSNDEQTTEQIVQKSDMKTSHASEMDAEAGNIVAETLIAAERMSPTQRSALGTEVEVNEVVEGVAEAEAEVKMEEEKVESKEQAVDIHTEEEVEIESGMSNQVVSEECINNNNLSEYVNEEPELSVSNDISIDHNGEYALEKAELPAPNEASNSTILPISEDTIKNAELPAPNETDHSTILPISEDTIKKAELPSPYETDHSTILPISECTIKEESCEDEDDDGKSDNEELMNGGDEAHHAFPQPVVCNYGYDSIISLPDPPSTEEIKQLGDFVGIESNQLDSLPPPSPPPPPIATDLNDNNTATTKNATTTSNTSTTEEESTTAQLKLKQILSHNPVDLSATEHCQVLLTNGKGHDTTNGNIIENGADGIDVNGHETINGHEDEMLATSFERDPTAAPNTEDSAGTRKVSQTPLTPPESPPLSSPVHYTNGVSAINGINSVNGGICGGPLPLVVDVNGS